MHMSDTLHNNTVEAAASLIFLTSHWVVSEWQAISDASLLFLMKNIPNLPECTAWQYSGIFLEFMKAIQKGNPENQKYGALKSHLSSLDKISNGKIWLHLDELLSWGSHHNRQTCQAVAKIHGCSLQSDREGTIPRTKAHILTDAGDINLLPTCSLNPYNQMSLVWKGILQVEEREMWKPS